MKLGYIGLLITLSLFMIACSGKSIEERSFTYYDTMYGKFYLEVDRLVINDIDDVITLTMKFTSNQAQTFTLDTLDYGKAGMMLAELRNDSFTLYSSDDLEPKTLSGEVLFDFNEKVFRNIQFSPTPFDDTNNIERPPSGEYVIWLYVEGEFLVETDIVIDVNI